MGSATGVYAFDYANGSIGTGNSFRVVLPILWYVGIRLNRFVNSNDPWFGRGWHYYLGSGAGVFAFDNNNGHANVNDSFRVVSFHYDKNPYER